MSTKRLLFLTLGKIDSIKDSGIYNDLAEELSNHIETTILCPHERRYGYKSNFITEGKVSIYQQLTLNIQKTKKFEKVLSTFLVEYFMIFMFLRKLRLNKFDILLVSTPPIFLHNFFKVFKSFNPEARIYLLLKDIYPQNAVDLGFMRKDNLFYKYSRKVERRIYAISDRIGCMSQGNIKYISTHNPEVAGKLELNPNSINLNKYPTKKRISPQINPNKLKLIYGGNLGKPQNPTLICDFISRLEDLENIEFNICGNGTGFLQIKDFIERNEILKTNLVSNLNKQDYFKLLEKSDVGLVFLDNNFTIPNYPSRIIDYIYFELTIISITDSNTDITELIETNNLGYCFTDSNSQITKAIDQIKEVQKRNCQEKYKGALILKKYFNVEDSANNILNLVK